MAGIPFVAIYKNTTIDKPGSILHAKQAGAQIITPPHSMLQLIEKNGWPSIWTRFCCRELKEYKVYDRAVQGIRRAESAARNKRYKEPEICRVYSSKDKARVYLPLLNWTNEDVERFITERGIKCHPHYYDKAGRFHVERRVGCIGCPQQSDRGRADFVRWPKMFRLWCQSFNKWFISHPNSKTSKKFNTVYDAIYMKMFCENMEEYYKRIYPSMFGEYRLDTKKFLEEYFNIDLSF